MSKSKLEKFKYVRPLARLISSQCKYPADAKNKLFRDTVIVGVMSQKTYYNCIEKGTDLILTETLDIVQFISLI